MNRRTEGAVVRWPGSIHGRSSKSASFKGAISLLFLQYQEQTAAPVYLPVIIPLTHSLRSASIRGVCSRARWEHRFCGTQHCICFRRRGWPALYYSHLLWEEHCARATLMSASFAAARSAITAECLMLPEFTCGERAMKILKMRPCGGTRQIPREIVKCVKKYYAFRFVSFRNRPSDDRNCCCCCYCSSRLSNNQDHSPCHSITPKRLLLRGITTSDLQAKHKAGSLVR